MSEVNKSDIPWTKSPLTCHVVRLTPGQNITDEIVKYVRSQRISAAFVMTCVGSVTKAKLRLADATAENRQNIISLDQNCEITSLVGTISESGVFHLHASLGDSEGNTTSGHVVGGMETHTTAEIVLGQCNGLVFNRRHDKTTGFDELVIDKR